MSRCVLWGRAAIRSSPPRRLLEAFARALKGEGVSMTVDKLRDEVALGE